MCIGTNKVCCCIQNSETTFPAGYEQKRLLEEALENLPSGVIKVLHRNDTAGYQKDLLRYMAEGENKRFGVIEFAVGVRIHEGFKKAALEIPDKDWHPVYNGKENPIKTNQEWAEVCYVPEWAARKKDGPVYRFIAIREPLARQQELEECSMAGDNDFGIQSQRNNAAKNTLQKTKSFAFQINPFWLN